jgi:hypothetical protein
VEIEDQAGDIVNSSAVVTLTSNGPGSFAPGSVISVSAVSGIATFANLKFNKEGALYTITPHSGTLTTMASNFFSITAAAPSVLKLVGGGSVLFAPNTTNVGKLRVQALDMFGNPVPSATVTFTAPLTGASGKFNGILIQATAPTDMTGTATAPPFVTNSSLGSFTIIASLGALELDIAATTFFSSITVRI